MSAIVPTATATRFGIVTSKVRRAVSPSVSRIVAVALATETVAVAPFDDVADTFPFG